MKGGGEMSPRKLKILAAVLIALAIAGLSVGAVFAYLSATSGSVTNTLTPEQEQRPTISETFNDTVKSDVKVDVGNPGYAVYVRAAIVVTWEDEDGNVYAQAPKETDYTLELGGDWFKEGNFYYHRKMVPSGEKTGVLIERCAQKSEAPADYRLHVEIIAQTIQALGGTDAGNTPPVTDAWKISVDSENNLVDPNP